MGRSEALVFAKEGAAVVVADVLEAEGRQVADGLAKAGRFAARDPVKGDDLRVACPHGNHGNCAPVSAVR